MYNLINEQIEDIALAFADPKEGRSLREYSWLCDEPRKKEVAVSKEYGKRYRRLWRMQCGKEYGNKYFVLLESNKKENNLGPLLIVRELYNYLARGGRKTIGMSCSAIL